MKKKNNRRYITCPKCKRKTNLSDDFARDSIEKIGNQNIFYCYCGNEILL